MSRFLTNMLLTINIVSSLAMAFYAYRVLWGGMTIGFIEIQMMNPAQVTFSMAIFYIAVPGALYVLAQIVGMAFRSPANVWLYIGAVLTSLVSLSVIGSKAIMWWTGNFEPTLFQKGALWVWQIDMVSDVLTFVVGARFLQRSYFGHDSGIAHPAP